MTLIANSAMMSSREPSLLVQLAALLTGLIIRLDSPTGPLEGGNAVTAVTTSVVWCHADTDKQQGLWHSSRWRADQLGGRSGQPIPPCCHSHPQEKLKAKNDHKVGTRGCP